MNIRQLVALALIIYNLTCLKWIELKGNLLRKNFRTLIL